jgi:COP9 signalosome complex subunit 2
MDDEDVEYNFDEDGGDGGEGGDAVDETENTYYDAKNKIDSAPQEAVKGFLEVLKLDTAKGKWSFKAFKQLVRTYLKLRDFPAMLKRYDELLQLQWTGRSRNDIEKAINKLVEAASSAGPEILVPLYDITLRHIGGDMRNYEKLWFNIKLKAAQLAFDTNNYDRLTKELEGLKAYCRDPDNAKIYDVKKGTQLMSLYALEIQMYTEKKDKKKLRELYQEASDVKSAIPPPKILGIIKECGGKMFMQQQQWNEADEAFFSAFKNYDDAGHPRRLQCLKYLVLANMLSGSTINPFDSMDAKPYKNDPEIVAMTELIDAYTRKDIKQFERILKTHAKTITQDPFIYQYLEPLLKKTRVQVLLNITKPYTKISIAFIAKELDITTDEVEALCVGLILDGESNGVIDQVNGILILGADAGQSERRYSALGKWSQQIQAIQNNFHTRIV